jgi:glycosyltransferase involved in cell wall biosynthesis
LLEVVAGLKRNFRRIVIVDDGSTEGIDFLREAEGDVEKVLRHGVNRGKGAALKTGLDYIGEENVVTVDADGQHAIEDIVAVADAVDAGRSRLVLGARGFTGKVPLRSRFGNFWARWIFFFTTGIYLRDTQTGLRGIPASLIKRIRALPGERYEYEAAMLADIRNHGEKPLEIRISTVYIDGNSSSHFRPLADAVRIYRSFIAFCASGILSFLIDNAVFALSMWWMASHDFALRRHEILISLVAARAVSSNFNYLCNRFMVFNRARASAGGCARAHRSYFGYFALVLAMAAASWMLTGLAAAVADVDGAAVTYVKIAVEAVLFVLSYHLQRKIVFGGGR